MDVNKIKITPIENSQEIVVPFDMRWDLLSREESYLQEEKNIIEKVVGQPPNYELVRFSRRPIADITQQVYQFNFYSASTDTWHNTYFTKLTADDVRFKSSAYRNSFFKLDFYDSPLPQTQRIYLTAILGTYQSDIDFYATLGVPPPTLPCIRYRIISFVPAEETLFTYTDCCGEEQTWSSGGGQNILDFCVPFGSTGLFEYFFSEDTELSSIDFVFDGTNYDPFNNLNIFVIENTCECEVEEEIPDNSYIIYRPQFTLDHVGNTEGYYLYWYEDPTLLNINQFFMRVKYFDAATGTYTTFTINPQSNYTNRYAVPNDDFYVRVDLYYPGRVYELVDLVTNNILSTNIWYEYVNPPVI
jgi:hypothetical protein